MAKLHSTVGLVLWLLVSFLPAIFGARFGPGEWYQSLQKPTLTPPNWVFGPVWTVLYLMMGVAAWLVWRNGGFAKNALPLLVFVVQLALNGMWTWIFFGRHRIDLALIDILLLDLGILVTLILFWRVRVLAGVMLIPYLAWTLFATFLNLEFWRLNR